MVTIGLGTPASCKRHQQRQPLARDHVVVGVSVGALIQRVAEADALVVAVHIVDPRNGVRGGERVERVVREVGPAVVLTGDVDGLEVGVGGCGAVESDSEDRDIEAFEALEDAAVGSVRVADQHKRHRQRRARRGEVALLDRRDSRALRVAEDDDRLARGLCVDRLIEVGHALPDRLVEGHGSRHRHELLGRADRGGRARPGAAESGQHDVVVVGVGGVAVDELRAVLRSAQRMPGAAHDQCGRGEGDQRRHGLHARQHDRGRDRQHDDTGGIEDTAHSSPQRQLLQLDVPARRASRM